MRDLDYLKVLSKQFKNIREASAEFINLHAILDLPKGTEYYFSDLHGEYESFIHLLHSASGVIRNKIHDMYANELSDSEILVLANLIYYPKEKLANIDFNDEKTFAYQKDILKKIIPLLKKFTEKYTKSKIRKSIPKEYTYIIEELLYNEPLNTKKELFYDNIYNYIIEIGIAKEFITGICELIQKFAVDTLHILGDIFDRGPRPDYIMEELINFSDVDFVFGNHDIEWMGASLGNEALICCLLRNAIRYNTIDLLEDGYGINLRPLSMFAEKNYKDGEYKMFMPKAFNENDFDNVEPMLLAKMQKAMAILQFKYEGQLIKKHPEYQMQNRIMLERINYDNFTIDIDGNIYELNDRDFPTIDKREPLRLSSEEQELMKVLKLCFTHAKKLRSHIDYLYRKGAMYKIVNNNLMFHGCIPFDNDGNFLSHNPTGENVYYKGKELLDYFNNKIFEARFSDDVEKRNRGIDRMWYMWCGPKSPLFGKDNIKTFEMYFVDDKTTHKENLNPYYKYAIEKDVSVAILKEFGLNENGHIINGHVPVKVLKGESPVKADGKLFVIDGGISKSYQEKTGIAGYTLIYDSINIKIAKHNEYKKDKDNTPETTIIECVNKDRVRIKDTDAGIEINTQIEDLKELINAYRTGLIKEVK